MQSYQRKWLKNALPSKCDGNFFCTVRSEQQLGNSKIQNDFCTKSAIFNYDTAEKNRISNRCVVWNRASMGWQFIAFTSQITTFWLSFYINFIFYVNFIDILLIRKLWLFVVTIFNLNTTVFEVELEEFWYIWFSSIFTFFMCHFYGVHNSQPFSCLTSKFVLISDVSEMFSIYLFF